MPGISRAGTASRPSAHGSLGAHAVSDDALRPKPEAREKTRLVGAVSDGHRNRSGNGAYRYRVGIYRWSVGHGCDDRARQGCLLQRPRKAGSGNGERRQSLGPAWRQTEFSLAPHKRYAIEARTVENQLIEAFDEDLSASFTTYVYNVAGATPLANYTVYYGGGGTPSEPTRLGAPRWFDTDADYVLTDPPRPIQVSAGESRSRVVLAAMPYGLAGNVDEWVSAPEQRTAVISAHARWDPADTQDILTWLSKASEIEPGTRILAARLADNPNETVSLRAQQDATKGDKHREVCQHQTEQLELSLATRTFSILPPVATQTTRTGTAPTWKVGEDGLRTFGSLTLRA